MDLTITPQTISSTIANYGKITLLNKLIEKFVRIAKNVESIDEKLTSLENDILPIIKHKMSECSKHNYKESLIQEAKELGIDITIDLEYKGENLLYSAEYKSNNINIYGTKLMEKLFTNEEMAACTFEMKKSKRPSLDKSKINMIKACYFLKLKSKENFLRCWPNIVRSLQQKCGYSCKKVKKLRLCHAKKFD